MPAMLSPPSARWLVYVLFLLSGGTGLVYEVVWSRQLVFLLGGTTYAITTVLVAFMSGLALGSWLSGRLGSRVRRPGRGYGLLEIAVGLYALAVPVLLRLADPLYRAIYQAVSAPGSQTPMVILTAARFCVGALVLLLPATCMGATLPMLVRYVVRDAGRLGRSTGLLYGINTCGAMIGTLLAGFVLIPRLGLTRTTWSTAAVNVGIGLLALRFLRAEAVRPVSDQAAVPAKPTKQARPSAAPIPAVTSTKDLRQTVLVVAGLSGLAAMVYQIAWTRALIMSLGSSTYAFTCILAAFILGLGVGSLAVAGWVDRWSRPVLLLAAMELGIGLAAIFIVPLHGQMPAMVHDLVVRRHQNYASLLVAEFVLVIAITFVPTFLMGAAFPLIVRIAGATGRDAGATVGQVYSVNTVGTIVGSFLAGFVLIRGDVLGIQNSIVAAALLNACAAAWLLTKSGPAGRLMPVHAAAGGFGVIAVLAVGVLTGPWPRDLLTSGPFIFRGDREPAGRQIEYFFEDVDATVSVERIGGPQGSLTLCVNGKPDASNVEDLRTQLLVGHLPALFDRVGAKACIIGLGSGMTLAAVARYPSYQQIDCVEISEGVIGAAETFKHDTYDILHSDPRVRLIRADGRNHLLLTDETYDLIVSEPSNPWLAGISNLFTREFFDLCRQRLAPHGVLAVWLQSYSTSQANFRMVLRTLMDVFDSASVWEAGLPDYCLIAGPRLADVPLADLVARFEQPAVRGDLARIALRDIGSVLGNYVTGGPRLRQWVEDAPVHTDDNALLEFRAPWDLYSQSHLQIAEALLDLQGSPLGGLVRDDTDAATAAARARTDACVAARRLRVRGMRQWEEEQHAASVHTLVEAYRADPGDFLVYQLLMEHVGELEEWSRDEPALRELVDEIEQLPPPEITLPSMMGTPSGPAPPAAPAPRARTPAS
ncbi:MAG: fused MFS/spermidine synthase [Planctomycetes bacterium]|nr:fused MFS/spermidine synthase [Planctomycetota bacterium]